MCAAVCAANLPSSASFCTSERQDHSTARVQPGPTSRMTVCNEWLRCSSHSSYDMGGGTEGVAEATAEADDARGAAGPGLLEAGGGAPGGKGARAGRRRREAGGKQEGSWRRPRVKRPRAESAKYCSAHAGQPRATSCHSCTAARPSHRAAALRPWSPRGEPAPHPTRVKERSTPVARRVLRGHELGG